MKRSLEKVAAHSKLLWAGGALWLAVIAVAFCVLLRVEMKPGLPAKMESAPRSGEGVGNTRIDQTANGATIPTGLNRSAGDTSDRMTLLMFLHPKCPCSEASVTELASLIDEGGDRFAAHVYLYAPSNKIDAWKQTNLWQSLVRIPHVEATADPDAVMARLYGARTSGQVFLLDGHGRIVFCGGITPARACDGKGDAYNAILALIRNGDQPSAPLVTFPVFGCALYSEQSPPGVAQE